MSYYIPLHAHSATGSIGDSILKISDYVKKAKEYGLPAVALTEHGSLASIYNFYYCAKENGIKPIIGCEVYESLDRLNKDKKSENASKMWHLVLLAKNNEGLKNLIKIVNDAQLNGFYYKPRTDMNFMKKHGKGIICLSGCVGGKIPQAILNNNKEAALKYIKEYKDVFDEFYLEIQPGTFEEQLIVNQSLIELSEETDTPLIVTNDIHYLNQEDYVPHDAHVKIHRKKKMDDELVYADTIYWFMDRDAIISAFRDTIPKDVLNKAIKNTVLVAEKCEVNLDSAVKMPRFNVDEKHSEHFLLTQKTFKALENIKHTLDDPAKYVERLLYELDVIHELGFSGYFLIVEDFIRYARDNGIAVGPGRGSVGGSLVAYLLGITLADPIKYDLLFERFLSKHRKSVPDIDMDFDSEMRDKMMNYAVKKYGENNTALVSTLQVRKARGAIRDTARVLGIDLDTADTVAKLIPQIYYDDSGEKMTDLSIEDSLKAVPELKKMYEAYPELFDMASKISDIPYTTSIHAAGMIISPEDLTDKLPLIRSNKEGIRATALNLEDAEKAGYVKFDFLSLASLNVYEKTQQDTGYRFDVLTNDFDDEKVWDLIGSRYTTGLFQISSQTYKTRMPRLKPRSIPELAACLALLRGPSISSGADKIYVDILEGRREIDPIHPLYYKATKNTNGILIYQEQLMELAVNFGFTLEEGYDLVKIVAKKHVDKLKAFKDEFFKKAEEKSVSVEITEKIWKIIVHSGQYLFNRSHALTYSILTYISAYLKTYYPKEFLVNLLTNAYERNKKEEIKESLMDFRRYGIKFLPLDINKSKWEFSIEGDKVRIGFCAVKGLGKIAAEEIMKKRPFDSLNDFLDRIERNKCSKRNIIPLIFSGAFDEFSNRKMIYQKFMKSRKEEPVEVIQLQSKEKFKADDAISVFENILLRGEYLSDPANYLEEINFESIRKNQTFKTEAHIKEIRKTKDRRNKEMAFITLATGDGYIDCIIFSNVYQKYKHSIHENNVIEIKAKKVDDFSCIAQAIQCS